MNTLLEILYNLLSYITEDQRPQLLVYCKADIVELMDQLVVALGLCLDVEPRK